MGFGQKVLMLLQTVLASTFLASVYLIDISTLSKVAILSFVSFTWLTGHVREMTYDFRHDQLVGLLKLSIGTQEYYSEVNSSNRKRSSRELIDEFTRTQSLLVDAGEPWSSFYKMVALFLAVYLSVAVVIALVLQVILAGRIS